MYSTAFSLSFSLSKKRPQSAYKSLNSKKTVTSAYRCCSTGCILYLREQVSRQSLWWCGVSLLARAKTSGPVVLTEARSGVTPVGKTHSFCTHQVSSPQNAKHTLDVGLQLTGNTCKRAHKHFKPFLSRPPRITSEKKPSPASAVLECGEKKCQGVRKMALFSAAMYFWAHLNLFFKATTQEHVIFPTELKHENHQVVELKR